MDIINGNFYLFLSQIMRREKAFPFAGFVDAFLAKRVELPEAVSPA
jgi:hypothetical protein